MEASLALRREIGHRTPSSVLLNLGDVALRQGDCDAARKYLEQAENVCDRSANPQMYGQILQSLSAVDCLQGRFAEARAHCSSGLRQLRSCGARVDLPF